MPLKSIKYTSIASLVRMGDVSVRQPFPNQWSEQIDPFLLFHHWKDTLPGNQKESEVGVGPHPHTGFCPVTFIYQGEVHHRDSLGNSSIVGAGGMQWIHAGKGIIHSERPSKKVAEKGGGFELIQLWINLPAFLKKTPAAYHFRHAQDMPHITTDRGKVNIRLLAGTYKEKKGFEAEGMDIQILDLQLQKGGKFTHTISKKYNTFIYQLSGDTLVNKNVCEGDFRYIWFEQEDGEISVEAHQDARLLLLVGKPLHEPIYSHGPFVMNNQSELLPAMRDYQMGKMGVLIEEFK
jgi:redox-sensitive bicupin YhaK (pirin superfamily)